MTAVTKPDLRPLAEVTLPYMIQAFSLLGVRQKVSHEMGGQATYNCPIAEFRFRIIFFLHDRPLCRSLRGLNSSDADTVFDENALMLGFARRFAT
jgi:hypothetical protein